MARLYTPVTTLGIIWGGFARRQNARSGSALRVLSDGNSFSGPQTDSVAISGDIHSDYAPDNQSNRLVLNDVTSARSGRSLLVAVLNGRVSSKGGCMQPTQYACSADEYSRASSGHHVLQALVQAVTRNKPAHPVDVFMLVAERPTYVDKLTQQLPEGSVVVAVKTPALPDRNWFKQLLRQREWPFAPDARELLVDYLLSDPRNTKAMPKISVSGHKSMDLWTAWQTLASRRQLDKKKLPAHMADKPGQVQGEWFLRQHEPQTVERLLWLQGQRNYAPDTLDYLFYAAAEAGVPDCPSVLAYPLMAMADEIFGPLHSWQQLDQLRTGLADAADNAPPVIPAGYVPVVAQTDPAAGLNTGAIAPVRQRGATKLSEGQIARLPKSLRKFAGALPGSLRRALK